MEYLKFKKYRGLHNRSSGFTLVELIVVIAIIGILAAVIGVTYVNITDRAKLAADKTDAKNMTTILQEYFYDTTVHELEAPEIIAIVNATVKNYTFKPRSSKWSFWYNTESKKIEVHEHSSKNIFLTVNAMNEFRGRSLEEVKDGFIYLDTKGELAEALHKVRNLSSTGAFPKFEGENLNANPNDSLAMLLEKYQLNSHIQQFHPDNTLYINASGGFTNASNKAFLEGKEHGIVNKVVFASGIKIIPNTTMISGRIRVGELKGETFTPLPIKLPVTVVTIEKGAFTRIISASSIVSANLSKLQVQTGAFDNNQFTKEFIQANTNLVKMEKELDLLNTNGEIVIEVVQNDTVNRRFTAQNTLALGYQSVTEIITLGANEKIRLNISEVKKTVTGIDYSSKVSAQGNILLNEDHIRLFGEEGLIAYVIVLYRY